VKGAFVTRAPHQHHDPQAAAEQEEADQQRNEVSNKPISLDATWLKSRHQTANLVN